MKSLDESPRVRYINEQLVEETKMMKEIAKKLNEDKKAIQLSPNEGQILSTLAKLSKPKNLVEIGTLYGYSACWLLEAMFPGAKLYTVEQNEENYTIAKNFLQKHERVTDIECVNTTGLEFLSHWPEKKAIDFLFIDADKGGYLDYLKMALKHMNSGAVVVADNTFLFGHVLKDEPPKDYSKNTWAKMRELNKILSGATGEFFGTMLPTYQGFTIGVKI